jgi:hypothetical protein
VFSGPSFSESITENYEGKSSFKKVKRDLSDISAASEGGARPARRAEARDVIVLDPQLRKQVEVIDVRSST